MRPLSVILAMLALTVPAQAQMACGDHDKIVAHLAAKYGEVPKGFGVSGRILVELLLSPDGSWTVLNTDTSGTTCLLSSGTDWEMRPAVPPPKTGNPT